MLSVIKTLFISSSKSSSGFRNQSAQHELNYGKNNNKKTSAVPTLWRTKETHKSVNRGQAVWWGSSGCFNYTINFITLKNFVVKK